MKRLGIFASGSGSNAVKIIEYFADSHEGRVVVVFCNNPKAGIIEKAAERNIPVEIFDRETFKTDAIIDKINSYELDWIVLAGFLWLMPKVIIEKFANRIVNIHPALLPDYGGKGMYGMNVHEAVWRDKLTETGITIHYVNDHYDSGDIIFQASCPVFPEDNPQEIQARVLQLEHKYFATIVEALLRLDQN
ncbi:MAG: phosphoribosylglycinamide formyltransferase [Saprospiraceae bacterium]|nr:phosphoribosylglycinamide formyltransferase [Saprospiraceae bacterium]